jgi:FixJ family two-component response regulator
LSKPEREQMSTVSNAVSNNQGNNAGRADQVVLVIDDDPSVRAAIASLIEAVGLTYQTFGSGQEFLEAQIPDVPRCLVLDVRLPGLSGLNLQRELRGRNIQIPIIFITGHGDIPMTVQAMKAGAVEFLTKPFRDQDLLDAIEQAIQRDRSARALRTELGELEKRYELLTPREREVMHLVVAGLLNKQIAVELDISEKTVNVHRSQVMQKMRAQSLAELVRTAEKLRLLLVQPQEHSQKAQARLELPASSSQERQTSLARQETLQAF